MRTRIALALALCAAAAPLHAQKADSVYHGAGYDVVLPARYRFVNSTDGEREGVNYRMYIFGNDAGGVLVIRMEPRQQIGDTSIATRRAVLQLMRAGMMEAAGEMRMTGEPVEIVRDDRVTLRSPVVATANGQTMRTTIDISVSRRGPVSMWMVMPMREHPTPRGDAIGLRALDSFSLTGEGNSMADADEKASDLDEKP
jgi:hypothetical protein